MIPIVGLLSVAAIIGSIFMILCEDDGRFFPILIIAFAVFFTCVNLTPRSEKVDIYKDPKPIQDQFVDPK